MNDLTVLVNSWDGSEDCWPPFFKLFQLYWPECSYPIVLNTDLKSYEHPGLSIHCSRAALREGRSLTWSERFRTCLGGDIRTPFVLYMQEDYFLEAPVRTTEFDYFLNVMRRGEADVIRLMECGGAGPWLPTADDRLWTVARKSRYRISLQVGLWRTEILKRHIRAHETGWQLEVFGSVRARRYDERVLCVNRDRYHGPGKEVFQYTPTGVTRGRWERFIPGLFERHGIECDFAVRGFRDEVTTAPVKAPLARRGWNRLRSLV